MYILFHFYSFHMLKTYVNSYIYIYMYIYIECKINDAASFLKVWRFRARINHYIIVRRA